MIEETLKNDKTEPTAYDKLLTRVSRNSVLEDPEYSRYCKYYNFTDINNDKHIMGFCLWKSLGMRL